jgi:hypothetical protein
MSPVDLPPGGINARFVDSEDLLVGKPRWNELAAVRAVIGQCRACGGDLQAIEPSEHDAQGEDGEITWYEAKCRDCGREIAAPNGRMLARSSAHREMPRGWLERRNRRDDADRKAAERREQ